MLVRRKARNGEVIGKLRAIYLRGRDVRLGKGILKGKAYLNLQGWNTPHRVGEKKSAVMTRRRARSSFWKGGKS